MGEDGPGWGHLCHTDTFLVLDTNIHWKACTSHCISRSMNWAEGGYEPMKINLFIIYNNIQLLSVESLM